MQNSDPGFANMLHLLEVQRNNQHNHLSQALEELKGVFNSKRLAVKSLQEQTVKNKTAADLQTLIVRKQIGGSHHLHQKTIIELQKQLNTKKTGFLNHQRNTLDMLQQCEKRATSF